MRALAWMVLGVALLGCGNAAQQEKIDDLSKKVTTLDKRVKAIEGPKGKANKSKGKGKAATKSKAKAPAGPKGKVALSGDATKVLLANGKRKFTLPGDVPAGEYKILASFDDASEATEVGDAVVVGESTLTISCAALTETCTAAAAD